jgi:hypothetical protein
MTAARSSDDEPRKRQRHVDRGGLPPDDDLSAFAAKAAEAFGQPGAPAPRASLAAVPDTSPPPLPAPAGTPAAAAPAEQDSATQAPQDVSDPGADADVTAPGSHLTQTTVNVAIDVAARFRRYTRRESLHNNMAVFSALNAGKGRYREIVAARQPQPDPSVLFTPAPRQRVTTEARPTTQLNFRLTYEQLGQIKQLARQAGAKSTAAFIDAVLDEFLPAAKKTPGTRAGDTTQGPGPAAPGQS